MGSDIQGYQHVEPLVLSIVPPSDAQIREKIDAIRYEIDFGDSNQEIICRSCVVLADFAGGETFESRSLRNIDFILRHGGMDAVLVSMAKYPCSARIQEKALLALWRFSRNSEAREYIAVNSIGKILSAMRMHFDALRVQELACSALLNLSAEPKISTLIAEHALEDILILIRTDHDRTTLLELACAVLRNLALNPFNANAIMKLGFCDIITRFKDSLSKCKFQVITLGILSNLSTHDDNDRLIALQGIDFIFATMQHHLESREMQKEAMNCIWNLTFNLENKRSISVAGLSWILTVMSYHIDNSEIQAAACAVLGNLFDFGEYGMNDNVWAIQHVMDARDSCVRAMLTMPKEDAVIEEGCRALLLLLVGPFGPSLRDGGCQTPSLLHLAERRARRAGPKDRACATLFAQACDAGHTAMMRKLLNRPRPAPGESVARSSYKSTAMAATYLATLVGCSEGHPDVQSFNRLRSHRISDGRSLALGSIDHSCGHALFGQAQPLQFWRRGCAQMEQAGLSFSDEESFSDGDRHNSPQRCRVKGHCVVALPIGRSTVGSGYCEDDQAFKHDLFNRKVSNEPCQVKSQRVHESNRCSTVRTLVPTTSIEHELQRHPLAKSSGGASCRCSNGSEHPTASRTYSPNWDRKPLIKHEASYVSAENLVLTAADPPYSSSTADCVDQGWSLSDISDVTEAGITEYYTHAVKSGLLAQPTGNCGVLSFDSDSFQSQQQAGFLAEKNPCLVRRVKEGYNPGPEWISGGIIPCEEQILFLQELSSPKILKNKQSQENLQKQEVTELKDFHTNSKQGSPATGLKEVVIRTKFQIDTAGYGQAFDLDYDSDNSEISKDRMLQSQPEYEVLMNEIMEQRASLDTHLNDSHMHLHSRSRPLPVVKSDLEIEVECDCVSNTTEESAQAIENERPARNQRSEGGGDQTSREACQKIVQVLTGLLRDLDNQYAIEFPSTTTTEV